MHAFDNSGAVSPWTQYGTWTVIETGGTPSVSFVSPNSGFSGMQTFTLVYADSAGASSLEQAWVYFNSTLANPAVSACMLYYQPSSNQLYLLSNDATQWLSATPGSSTTLSNSQCSLNVATTTVAASGSILTLTLPLTFSTTFSGNQNIYAHAFDVSGANSGWQQYGTWFVPGAPGTPSVVSLSPTSGSGATQTFTLEYSDTSGWTSIEQAWVYFNSSLANPAVSACMLYYQVGSNQIYLLNDTATDWSSAAPGTLGTLSNSQCLLNVASASVTLGGNNLTLSLPITFQSSFNGTQNTYMHAFDVSGANSGWSQYGAWTVP
jgi:hypothetical protein